MRGSASPPPLSSWCLLLAVLGALPADAESPPLGPGCVEVCEADYPPSPDIVDFMVDMTSLGERCPSEPCSRGSDNWPVTWADDGHQYTSWGDGCGFGGEQESSCKVSLGFGRILGPEQAYAASNIWGGRNPTSTATFGGKVKGLLSVDGILYAFRCGSGSGEACFDFQEIHRSDDKGSSWSTAGNPLWCNNDDDSRCEASEFVDGLGFFNPSFVNAGRDYDNAYDGYVYAYACNVKNPADWDVQQPGEIVLMRAPATDTGLMTKASWEYYAGPVGGEVTVTPVSSFSSSVDARTPVWLDDDGCQRVSGFYNWRIGKFFLTTQMGDRHRDDGARLGIFESDRPWGPWRTVLFVDPFAWPEPEGEGEGPLQTGRKSVFWNFSAKWLDASGTGFVLVGTFDGSDQWGSVEGSFVANHIVVLPALQSWSWALLSGPMLGVAVWRARSRGSRARPRR